MEPIPVDQLTRYYAEKKSTRFSVAHTCYLIIFDKSTKKVLWLSTLQSCATDVHVCVHGPFWSVKLKQQIFSVRLIDHTPGLRPMLPLHYWECSDLQHPDVGQDKLTWREKKKKKRTKTPQHMTSSHSRAELRWTLTASRRHWTSSKIIFTLPTTFLNFTIWKKIPFHKHMWTHAQFLPHSHNHTEQPQTQIMRPNSCAIYDSLCKYCRLVLLCGELNNVDVWVMCNCIWFFIITFWERILVTLILLFSFVQWQ